MTVKAKWQGGFSCLATVPGTDIQVFGDEPEELGGGGRGPSPFMLLKMSLAD